MPLDWQLPAVLTRRLGERSGRQRAMHAEGQLLLVLHEPPVAGNSQRTGRLFWRDTAGNWKSGEHGAGVQALMGHLAEYGARVERLEREMERADSAADYYALLREVAPMHRSARNLHATLQQAREMVPDDGDLINARDQSGELERALDLLHNDAGHGLDYTVAHHAEQQAEVTHQMAVAGYRLNLLAATFFPIATIGAIFGMNLSHGLEGPGFGGVFWFLLAVGLMAGVGLAVVIAKKPVAPNPSRPGKRPPRIEAPRSVSRR